MDNQNAISGPHYCYESYDTLIYRHDNFTLAVKKNILLFDAHSQGL